MRGVVAGEGGDIGGTAAECRQRHAHDVEAEEQVGAEPALADFGLQVAVAGGQHPHVDPDGAGAAHAIDLALLQRAEQLGLQAGVHLADLVEQQRAAGGRLGTCPADARPHR